MTVGNVSAADGSSGGSGSIRVGFLQGDVNQSRVVTLSDLGQVNAQIAQFVTAVNYLDGRERERHAVAGGQGDHQHPGHECVAGTVAMFSDAGVTGGRAFITERERSRR